jgi:hypothetical protein
LVPIPRDWENVHRERLELMCRAAEPVRRTGTTPDPEKPPAPRADEEPPEVQR